MAEQQQNPMMSIGSSLRLSIFILASTVILISAYGAMAQIITRPTPTQGEKGDFTVRNSSKADIGIGDTVGVNIKSDTNADLRQDRGNVRTDTNTAPGVNSSVKTNSGAHWDHDTRDTDVLRLAV